MTSSGERHNDYDAFAHAYTQDNDNNAVNAYYERSASLALLGDVAGQRVLDAGCGAGSHAVVMSSPESRQPYGIIRSG